MLPSHTTTRTYEISIIMKPHNHLSEKSSPLFSWLGKSWPYLVIMAIGVVLTISEYHYLARIEEQNLFLHTPLFFRQCMVASGGLLSWAAAFFTQLLYYPLLGVSVLCLLWGLLVFLLERTFHIPSQWIAVTLIPVAMLLLANVDLGYWIYYLKLRGFFFVATLGTLGAVALTWCYSILPSRIRTIFVPLSVICFYPLMGFYALFASILMAIVSWNLKTTHKAWAFADTLLAIMSIAAVPMMYYRWGYHETPLENIYLTALPIFQLRQDSFNTYYIPYVVVVLSIVAMAIDYREQRTKSKKARPWMQCLLLLALTTIVAIFWYKDGNFHREIAMRRQADLFNWEGVLRIAKETTHEPTRDMWLMKNLALTRLGRIGDEMYDYPNGAKPAAAPFTTRLVQWDGKMLYYNYGLPNYCYRWCMEDGVEYGWRVDNLKLMAKCSLVNGEMEAAKTFLNLLKKTLFHRKWAEHYDEYVHNPRLVTEDPEMLSILHLSGSDNYLSGDNMQIERFLIEHFAGTESVDPLLQEQALVAAMQLRNPQLFWLRFYQYTELHKSTQPPILYQQAACLFGGMDDKVDASKMPFNNQVKKSCIAFMDAFKRYRDQGMDLDRIKPLMKDQFHNTYYYDYFFNHYQEEVY